MEDEAQVLEGGRLGQHMLPNMPCARSDAVEDHNFCLGGADVDHHIFDCSAIRAEYSSLSQAAECSMHLLMWQTKTY